MAKKMGKLRVIAEPVQANMVSQQQQRVHAWV